ncbi:MAG: hypothetical protein OXI83_16005 [Gemmatimonadota bacterium]|nr:hypothetical protein [Gemmatimonadota bacterium]
MDEKSPIQAGWHRAEPAAEALPGDFIPTPSSWLNPVERWLAKPTTKAIRRRAFPSVHALERALHDYVEHSNDDPQPFVWTAALPSILVKIDLCKRTLETRH